MIKKLIRNKLGYFEVKNKPSKAELENYYAKHYYQKPGKSYQKSYSREEIEYFTNKARILLETLKIYKKKAKTYFEVGCGEGFFSNYLYKKKYNIFLNDFSNFGIKKFNPHLEGRLKTGDIFQIIKKLIKNKKKFDLICINNVLEHVMDPTELLKQIKKLMVKKTVLSLMVPNDFSSFQNLLIKKKLTKTTWIAIPDHLTYFNSNNLKLYCKNLGYKILSTQTDFPIEIFLLNKNSNYFNDKLKGKEAHKSRILYTNYLIKKDITSYIKLSEQAANLEVGRSTTIYLTL